MRFGAHSAASSSPASSVSPSAAIVCSGARDPTMAEQKTMRERAEGDFAFRRYGVDTPIGADQDPRAPKLCQFAIGQGLGSEPMIAGDSADQSFQFRARAAKQQVILGIDPSLRGTGYGIVRIGKACAQALAFGTISCPAGWEHSRCLLKITQTLRDVLRQHQPTVCVVEGLFFAQNLQTALVMGEARGASLVAAAEAGLEIYEIAPRKVKQAIVGYGAAQKLAVAKMVQRLLRLQEVPEADAADALALALAHAQQAVRYTLSAPKRI